MLDIVCDYLISTKESTNGLGVVYPQLKGQIKITSSYISSPDNNKSTAKQSKSIATAVRP